MKTSIKWTTLFMAGSLLAASIIPAYAANAETSSKAPSAISAEQHQTISPAQAKTAVEQALAKRHEAKWSVTTVAQTPVMVEGIKAPVYQVKVSGPKNKERTILVNAWSGKVTSAKHSKGEKGKHEHRVTQSQNQ